MAGQLVQVATETVTSPVGFVKLTGIDSDDVYMVTYNGVYPETVDQAILMRFTTSGTADTSSNYSNSFERIRTGTDVSSANPNVDYHHTTYNNGDNAGDETQNFIAYLYNFNNASGHSYFTSNSVGWYAQTTEALVGAQGGGTQTLNQACDGVYFYANSGNIASGTFTLYRVV
jgi:hypothetical protein